MKTSDLPGGRVAPLRRTLTPAPTSASHPDLANVAHGTLQKMHQAAAGALLAGRERVDAAKQARAQSSEPAVKAELAAARAQVLAAHAQLRPLESALISRGLARLPPMPLSQHADGGAAARPVGGARPASVPTPMAPRSAKPPRQRPPRLPTIPET